MGHVVGDLYLWVRMESADGSGLARYYVEITSCVHVDKIKEISRPPRKGVIFHADSCGVTWVR